MAKKALSLLYLTEAAIRYLVLNTLPTMRLQSNLYNSIFVITTLPLRYFLNIQVLKKKKDTCKAIHLAQPVFNSVSGVP